MFIYIEDQDNYYNYLLAHSSQLRLSGLNSNMLKDLFRVQVFPNMGMGSIDVSRICLNLYIPSITDEDRDILHSIMTEAHLQTIKINRYCYTSSYVEHDRNKCITEAEDLYNRLRLELDKKHIEYKFKLETSWGGQHEMQVMRYFFPEVIKCDWYNRECIYYPKTEECLFKCVTSALIGAQATVNYAGEIDEDKLLRHLIQQGIIVSLQSVREKVVLNSKMDITI